MARTKIVTHLALVVAATVGPRWATAESLLMVFRDKPPYSFVENGVEKGFLLERTRRVLARAGIEAECREMPPKRIFLEIERNEQAICPALVLVGADGVSYGTELDAMIKAFSGTIDRTLQSPLQVAKKLAAQRADFMLIDQDDSDFLIASNADFRGDGLVRIEYPDMPPGLKNYILCSQQVGDDILRRINTAIAIESVR